MTAQDRTAAKDSGAPRLYSGAETPPHIGGEGTELGRAPEQTRSAATEPRCAGCNGVFEVGDRYIEDTASGFTNADADPEIDSIIGSIFGSEGGKVRFCEDCTEAGGDYLFETFYGDEADSDE